MEQDYILGLIFNLKAKTRCTTLIPSSKLTVKWDYLVAYKYGSISKVQLNLEKLVLIKARTSLTTSWFYYLFNGSRFEPEL